MSGKFSDSQRVQVTGGSVFADLTGTVVRTVSERGSESVLVDLGGVGRHWVPEAWLKSA